MIFAYPILGRSFLRRVREGEYMTGLLYSDRAAILSRYASFKNELEEVMSDWKGMDYNLVENYLDPPFDKVPKPKDAV